MYLRPDEVARVLEKAGFEVDEVTPKAYGYRRGDSYVYVNREARMGRTALVIHPTLKEKSQPFAEPASEMKTCDHYTRFPLYLAGVPYIRSFVWLGSMLGLALMFVVLMF